MKKILLPEKKPFKRKYSQGKIFRAEGKIRLLSGFEERQKREAGGLILVGISAFVLSLFYFLRDSKVVTQTNFLFVYLGLGVYLFPLLLGLWGIQGFFDRPIRNYLGRVAGALGVFIFGSGLLGLEGGKFGSFLWQNFEKNFGVVPSTILCVFFTLSSMVFALDILYKDLLEFFGKTLQLLGRVLVFAWEIGIYLISRFIEAVKTSFEYALCTIRFFLRKNVEDALERKTGTPLISFFRENQLAKNVVDVTPLGPELLPETGKAAVLENSEHPPQTKEDTAIKTCFADQASVKVEEIQASTVFVGNDFFPFFGKLEVNHFTPQSFEKNDKASPNFPSSEERSNLESQPDPEKNDQEQEVHAQESEDLEVPESLDEHPIDQELKDKNRSGVQTKKSKKEVQLPPIELLTVPPEKEKDQNSNLEERSALLLKTLEDFGIKAQITAIVEGPAVSRFELKPAPGVKVARITSLTDDIALALSAPAIRIEAPIPGKPALGIEIPNPKPSPVYFYDLVKNDKFYSNDSLLNLALGVTISGRPVFADLTDMPHLLIAGSTGSGKSVCINTIIASILFQARPDEVKMVMIDPKLVELSSYNGIPHLISPVVTDPKKASVALLWAVEEMERRYELLAECGVRKISNYNEEIERLRLEVDSGLEEMPYIVIIIDELADLMMTASAQVESSICRLAQMARAVGMHLIIATQRPSVDVLTGIIKANLPSRIAFSVASHIDSRTILDTKGAEKLLGKGDMLFVPKGRSKPLRLQGAFISDRELFSIIDWVKRQGNPEYIEISPSTELGNDPGKEEDLSSSDDDKRLLTEIENYLLTQEKTSTSMLQRKFKIGYNRAARIMDILEEKGLVSSLDGSNKRRVLGRRSSS